ncbi:SusC/RagA family TonB-linked outer membrane protein [Chitinophaga arvensicola]|nr:SusC/RagA family TonB-linked outer membrane protein [Chitinophaga arvensicola]
MHQNHVDVPSQQRRTGCFLPVVKRYILSLVFILAGTGIVSAQKIILNSTNASLAVVLKDIRSQSGYNFVITESLLQKAKPVSIKVKDKEVLEVLKMIFRDQPLSFTVNNKTVAIGPKEGKEVTPEAATIPVKGMVLSDEQLPLPGASVKVKGTSGMATTDQQGQFLIPEVDEQAVLVVSFVGYATRELKVREDMGNIMLSKQTATLGEVKVFNTGYVKISGERATGAYSFISGRQLDNKLNPNVAAIMEGQVAGLTISPAGAIEIRGVSTFLAERAPLIVVDGFPVTGGLESINIDNIESITVLKDAVAASIYGARSSNGVIVVTTKQAKSGLLHVQFNTSLGWQQRPDLSYLRLTGASDYLDVEAELYNRNKTTALNTYNRYGRLPLGTYLMLAKDQGFINPAEADQQLAQLKENGGQAQLQHYLFRNQFTQQYNLSVSGGSEKVLTSMSARYIGDRGNALYTKDSRVILDFSNQWKPAKGVTLRVLSNINYNTVQAPLTPVSELIQYSTTSLLHPYDLVVNPATGRYQDIFAENPMKIRDYAKISGLKLMTYNPLQDLALSESQQRNLQLRLSGNLNIRLADGISIDGGGSWTRGNILIREISGADAFNMRVNYNDQTSVSNPSKHYFPDGSMLNESRNINQSYTLRGQLNFDKTYQRHSILAIGGAEVNRLTVDNNTYPTRFGYNDQSGTFAIFNYADYNGGLYIPDMLNPSLTNANIGSITYGDNRFVSWYGNASYEFDKRYLLSGSARLDLTNFFGTNPDFRYKPIWSIGGTYKISNESYFKAAFIDKLYVRGSYGINGNIDLNSGPFLIIAPGSAFSNLTGAIPYRITSPPNNSLRWEKTTTTNLGADVSLLKSRLNLTVDYYLRKSDLLLASDAIDPTTGYSSIRRNVGSINNTGVEVSLQANAIRSEGFTWSILGTFSYNKGKIIDYNFNYTFPTLLTGDPVNREGYPADALFSNRFAGISNAGSPQFYTQKDAKVAGSSVSIADLAYSGTTRAPFAFGLTNSFNYRQFGLSFLLVAKTGNVMRVPGFYGNNYQQQDVRLRWRKPGDELTSPYPKLGSTNNDPDYFSDSDFFIRNASFVKLRDVSFSYNIDRKYIRKTGLSNAGLYFQARNIAMITANKERFDPEAGTFKVPATYYVGLKADF